MTTDERLKNLIARFVLNSNYWGYLFSMVRRVEIKDFPYTMGVSPQSDGTISLFYNAEKVDSFEDKVILQILEHEGLHILNKHVSRFIRIIGDEPNVLIKQNRSEIFNYAADAAVNEQADLSEPYVDKNNNSFRWVTTNSLKLPPKQSTEFYYKELLKKAKKVPLPKFGCSSVSSRSNGKDISGSHEEWRIEGKGISDSSAFARKVEQNVNNIIRESLKTFNKSRGSLPGHIAELIKEALSPPKAPYYQIIKKLVTSCRYAKYKPASNRVNRKRAYTFYLPDEGYRQILPFPGKKRDLTFNIVILLDTSGSMGAEEIAEGLSGIKNIIENDRYCLTTVLQVDTEVQDEYKVKKISDIKFTIKGRGGTTLGPGLFRAKDLNCDVCLAFTDAGTENINQYSRKKMPKKLIWVVPEKYDVSSINRTGPIVRI